MAIITLVEWAKRNGMSADTAKHRANRGPIPAFKLGRDWVIDEDTPSTDKRYGGLSNRWKSEK